MNRRLSDIYDYEKLDPMKRLAMEMFHDTLTNPERLRIRVMPTGGTAAVFDFLDYDFMIGFNVEGLGTKNLIADVMYNDMKRQGYPEPERVYDFTGQDAAMTSAMDLVSVGADPFGYGDFITTGSDRWFEDGKRNRAVLKGFRKAAMDGGFAIPCGETPTLINVVYPETAVFEGASIGLIRPKGRFTDGSRISAGDGIYGLPAPGLNANGISKVRKIAAALPDGYFTRMPNGMMLGDAILVPTPVYVKPVLEMIDAGAHYVSPITGHGWQKVGRARRDFTYVVDNLPEPPEVFKFLVEEGARHDFDVSDGENYYVWNMGTSVALMAPPSSEGVLDKIVGRYGAWLQKLGHVEEGERKVVLAQKGIGYKP